MLKNFFNISDINENYISKIINPLSYSKTLKGKNIGLLFEKQSTRTRLSFSVGISRLGGNAIDLKIEELNFSRYETFEDTFKAFNCYLDGLIYRTQDHKRLLDAEKYFEKPIINALSDISHPCQTIADLYTLNENFKTLDLNVLWMGDMNNVCYSLVEAANLIPSLKLFICTPKEISKSIQWKFKNNIIITHKIEEIDLSRIHCVMTDVFISMNDPENDIKSKSLEKYIVDSNIMKLTHADSVFMHCLPAKVGLEVTDDVFRSEKSIVWKQAYNRMIAQNNLMSLIEW